MADSMSPPALCQLKMKYNVDFPDGYINGNNLSIEKL